jgi:hypothetical protein
MWSWLSIGENCKPRKLYITEALPTKVGADVAGKRKRNQQVTTFKSKEPVPVYIVN